MIRMFGVHIFAIDGDDGGMNFQHGCISRQPETDTDVDLCNVSARFASKAPRLLR
jgi:hypothetical protein